VHRDTADDHQRLEGLSLSISLVSTYLDVPLSVYQQPMDPPT